MHGSPHFTAASVTPYQAVVKFNMAYLFRNSANLLFADKDIIDHRLYMPLFMLYLSNTPHIYIGTDLYGYGMPFTTLQIQLLLVPTTINFMSS